MVPQKGLNRNLNRFSFSMQLAIGSADPFDVLQDNCALGWSQFDDFLDDFRDVVADQRLLGDVKKQ
jgi:hypothetical protein